MRPGWYGILLAAWMAGCTSSSAPSAPGSPDSPDPGESKAVPDHFNENLDVMMRATAHPCGADLDMFDGQIVVHYSYVYDQLGRLQRDIGLDPTGALHAQTDYSWDNAGHLTSQRDAQPAASWLQIGTMLYDTLGRLTQSRSTTSDTDPTDDQHTANTRITVDYADFDGLGHAAHSSELSEDFDAGTSQTTTTSYLYDDLGRMTSVEVRSASGELFQTEQRVYDDVAHTLTWQFHTPPILDGAVAGTYEAVEQYDSDGHWLSMHQENRGLDGVLNTTQDTVVTWDGDRELGEVTTFAPPDHAWKLHIAKTYKYRCDSARLASAPHGISALRTLSGNPLSLVPFRHHP